MKTKTKQKKKKKKKTFCSFGSKIAFFAVVFFFLFCFFIVVVCFVCLLLLFFLCVFCLVFFFFFFFCCSDQRVLIFCWTALILYDAVRKLFSSSEPKAHIWAYSIGRHPSSVRPSSVLVFRRQHFQTTSPLKPWSRFSPYFTYSIYRQGERIILLFFFVFKNFQKSTPQKLFGE